MVWIRIGGKGFEEDGIRIGFVLGGEAVGGCTVH